MKKQNVRYDLIAVAVIIIAAVLVGGWKLSTSSSSEDGGTTGGLSGAIVDMDPNRQMAGSPCHVMGGMVMGDCATREIRLEAWRYDWSEPTITVKTGELVRIIATSRDVSHGLAIPQIGFNMKIESGKTSMGEFMAPAPGTYTYGCSVMCGPGHQGHQGRLVVIE